MIRNAVAVLGAIGLVATGSVVNAHTASSGVTVTDLGTPKCAARNGSPHVVNGVFHQNLTVDTDFSADPWDMWPGKFSGAEYSALQGAENAPAVAGYKFTVPRSALNLVWGTPGPGDSIQFWMISTAGKTEVGQITGTDLVAALNWTLGFGALNVAITTPAPFNVVRMVSEGSSAGYGTFEWANFDATCR